MIIGSEFESLFSTIFKMNLFIWKPNLSLEWCWWSHWMGLVVWKLGKTSISGFWHIQLPTFKWCGKIEMRVIFRRSTFYRNLICGEKYFFVWALYVEQRPKFPLHTWNCLIQGNDGIKSGSLHPVCIPLEHTFIWINGED